MISRCVSYCFALSRLRFASYCFALSRLRFASYCCALPRLRFARGLLLFVVVAAVSYGQTETHVVIMHTNDIRGHVLAGPEGGGSARLATLVREIKPDLMLDAGEMMSGTLISDLFLGAPIIQVMNGIGYDAAAVGATEFSFGIHALEERARE